MIAGKPEEKEADPAMPPGGMGGMECNHSHSKQKLYRVIIKN